MDSAMSSKALPAEILADAIAMYERGATVPEIAKQYGMSERTTYRRLSESPSWKPAIEAKAQQAYERAQQECQVAKNELIRLKKQLDKEGIVDGVERTWRLAHARAVEQAADRAVGRAAWELERVCSRIYGQKQEVMNVQAIQVVVGGSLFGAVPDTPNVLLTSKTAG